MSFSTCMTRGIGDVALQAASSVLEGVLGVVFWYAVPANVMPPSQKANFRTESFSYP